MPQFAYLEKEAEEMTAKADRILKNAKVYSVTLDDQVIRADAVGISDGKIIFVGSNQDAEAYIGEDTVVTDCEGKSVLPGFGDAHMHFAWSAKKYAVADVANIVDKKKDTPDDVIKKIQGVLKDYAEEHKNYAVIQGIGWDRFWFLGALQGITRPFTRHDLDAAVPDRPVVMLSYCGHVMVLNTKAIEAAGLSADTPEPDNGIIRREADGYPDGYIQEPDLMTRIMAAIPGYAVTKEQNMEAMLKCQEAFFQNGTTLGADLLGDEENYTYIKEMAEEGILKVRMNGVHTVYNDDWEEDYAKENAEWGKYNVEDVFKVDTIKYFVDGTPAMLVPYTEEFCKESGMPAEYKGDFLWDYDNLMKSMETVRKDGHNIHVHAMGDYGAQATIDCMINAQKYNDGRDLRDAIAHCSFVTPEDRKRMGEHNIIGSIQPYWMSGCLEATPEYLLMLGLERAKEAFLCKSYMDAGVRCAFGSDFPVTPINPFQGMQIAITRRETPLDPNYEIAKDATCYNPEDCITLQQAIQAFTINTAYQWHLEDVTGSIEVGKSADLVLIDHDIEATPAEELYTIKVLETLLRGETVYKA